MLYVTCALIEQGQQLLICQRSSSMKLPLKWEFPGGKMETGETKEACLIREVQEELGIEIQVVKPLQSVQHHYPDFSLELYPFICKQVGGDLVAREHAQVLWVDKSRLTDYDWAAADIPIVKEYLAQSGQKE